MLKLVKVWDTAHEFGDVTIADFESMDDAILFAKAKASKAGGYVSTLWVGTDWNTRKQIPVD